MNQLQYDLVIGGCLGDGHISKNKYCKNCCYYEKHAEDQLGYIRFKLDLLREYSNMEDVKECKNKSGFAKQKQFWFQTRTAEDFNIFRDMDVNGLLDSLNHNSFAIWMMDDGTHDTNMHRYTLSMPRFSREELDYTVKIIKTKFSLSPSIKWKRDKESFDGLRFTVEDSVKICNIIRECDFGRSIAETMSYKMVV